MKATYKHCRQVTTEGFPNDDTIKREMRRMTLQVNILVENNVKTLLACHNWSLHGWWQHQAGTGKIDSAMRYFHTLIFTLFAWSYVPPIPYFHIYTLTTWSKRKSTLCRLRVFVRLPPWCFASKIFDSLMLAVFMNATMFFGVVCMNTLLLDLKDF